MLEIYLLSLLFRYVFKLHIIVQYMSLKIYTLFIMNICRVLYILLSSPIASSIIFAIYIYYDEKLKEKRIRIVRR